MTSDRDIPFDLHPDHVVDYLNLRIEGAKLVNGIWYWKEGSSFKAFPLQTEVRLVPGSQTRHLIAPDGA